MHSGVPRSVTPFAPWDSSRLQQITRAYAVPGDGDLPEDDGSVIWK